MLKKPKQERAKHLNRALDSALANAGADPKLRRALTAALLNVALQIQNLPVWIRAPQKGPEHWTGYSRTKLYLLWKEGKIRSISNREPGQTKGTRLFHLRSILALNERIEAEQSKKAA